MIHESALTRQTVEALRIPDPIREVRLVRVVEWRFYRDNPKRKKGRAQAIGMNSKLGRGNVTPNSGPTLVQWLSQRLGQRSQSSVENLLTRGRRIPAPVLRSLGMRNDLKAVGELLDTLAARYSKARGKAVDWEAVVDEHQHGPLVSIAPGMGFMAPNTTLLCLDARVALRLLEEAHYTFDSICIDPPYGIRRRSSRAGEMADDREGSLWCVPMLAKLIKPRRALCLWTTGGVMGRWVRALLDAEFVVADAITWDKGSAYAEKRGDEIMLVAAKGGLPETFNEDSAKVWSIPTLRHNHRLRVHPSPKPPELMERVLSRFTRPGEVVLDAFAGTGSVGVAAARLGRVYAGYEIHQPFHRIAREEIKGELVRLGLLPANVRRART